jgi:hypothetical protein
MGRSRKILLPGVLQRKRLASSSAIRATCLDVWERVENAAGRFMRLSNLILLFKIIEMLLAKASFGSPCSGVRMLLARFHLDLPET